MKQYWRWNLPIHRTWLFTSCALGILCGLAFSPLIRLSGDLIWPVCVALSAAYFLYRSRFWMVAMIFLAGFVIGGVRGADDIAELNVWQPAIGQVVNLRGIVAEDIDYDKRSRQVVRLKSISTSSGRKLPGTIWVVMAEKSEAQRGDKLSVKGKLSEGFGAFAASIYDAKLIRLERPVPGDVALKVRDSFNRKVRDFVDDPMASLGLGYLTGQRRGLPPDLNEALKVAGLTHIVVASGYNLTILIRLIKRLFEKRSRFQTVFFSGLLIAGFIGVTGISPSMTRAGLVAGLALSAWYLGRRFHPVTLLAIAAALTGLMNPSYVWGNLGWQLSFAAFAGVMILAPLMQAYFFGEKKPSLIRQIAGETVAAQLATAPLLLYSFGVISNVSVIANLLILPLVPLAMALTFITGVFGYTIPYFATLTGAVTEWLLGYMIYIAKITSSIPWAQTEFQLPLWGLAVLAAALVGICLYLTRVTKYSLRQSSIIE